MTIKELQKEIHALAHEKGWYEGQARTPLEMHMLFVSEVAEATECIRDGAPDLWFDEFTPDGALRLVAKPEGEASELVDVVIRILDYFEYRDWDLETILKAKHEFNKTRTHRHGGKRF